MPLHAARPLSCRRSTPIRHCFYYAVLAARKRPHRAIGTPCRARDDSGTFDSSAHACPAGKTDGRIVPGQSRQPNRPLPPSPNHFSPLAPGKRSDFETEASGARKKAKCPLRFHGDSSRQARRTPVCCGPERSFFSPVKACRTGPVHPSQAGASGRGRCGRIRKRDQSKPRSHRPTAAAYRRRVSTRRSV